MKKLTLILIIALYSICASAQAPAIQWQKSYGGRNQDIPFSILQTTDGGYIIAGSSVSNDADVSGHHGDSSQFDIWVVKLSSSGSIQWQKSLGGSRSDEPWSVIQTSDGGYIVAGYSTSNNGDVSGHHHDTMMWDCWIVKLSSSGSIEWQKLLGGGYNDGANSIKQTSDGGYIIAGFSESIDGDVTGNHGNEDYWIVKLSSTGNIQWQKSLGGTNRDKATSIQKTTDGGYIVAGYSYSNDGDVTGNNGGRDYWIVKLSDVGSMQWQKSLGGSDNEEAYSIWQTSDGGYIVAGSSNSANGDVTGNHGSYDSWVVKLSSSGSIQWQKSFGGSSLDITLSVQQTSDGAYIIAGTSESNNGDVTGNHGYGDFWIVKLSSSGNILWQKCLGGNSYENASDIQQTSDGGYIVTGTSGPVNGDVTINHGWTDFWVVKLKGTTGLNIGSDYSPISIMPNPATGVITIKGAENVNIIVSNSLGQLLKKADNANNISISEFPAGMYFIRILDNKGQIIHQDKIVKQ